MTIRLYIVGVPKTVQNPQGNDVRRVRRFADLTQAQLAEAAGVSRQTIVSIEAGDYSPSVHLAIRIAQTLDTTVEELFASKENQP